MTRTVVFPAYSKWVAFPRNVLDLNAVNLEGNKTWIEPAQASASDLWQSKIKQL